MERKELALGERKSSYESEEKKGKCMVNGFLPMSVKDGGMVTIIAITHFRIQMGEDWPVILTL